MPKARSRKKAAATAIRRECVYKRTGKPSETFYEKGGTVKQVTDFFAKKIGTSETCSDVEEPNGLDATYSDATSNYTVCSAIKCFTITLSFPLHIIISTAAFAISATE